MQRAHLRLSWIVLHALTIALVLLSLLTGLRMAIVHRPALLELSELLPQGELHSVHIWAAFALSAIACAYLLYRCLLKTGRSSSARSWLALYHRWLTRAGYLVFLSLLASGWLLLFDAPGLGPYLPELVSLHFYSALALLGYVLLHGGAYFIELGRSLFVRLFHPGKRITRHSLLLLGFAVVCGLVLWQVRAAQHSLALPVYAIDLNTLIQLDGVADEPAWQDAPLISFATHGGANFHAGASRVTMRALHNGVEVFFHITWEDPDKSLKHLPLLKTRDGWKVQGDGFYRFDEQHFYEDKFAVMLADDCMDGAAGTMHLGPQPLQDKPASWHGKGYHYADDGQVRDLWHWKAVRTNEMFLADDNLIGAPDHARPGERRYTAGYMPDSKESGSYVMNWQWYRADTVLPKRLPENPQHLAAYQQPDPAQSLSWVLPWFDYQPYQPALDQYPTGTLMPSVLYRSNRFEGDRADVRARGEWQDGKWSLELARKLDTQSAADVKIASGVCLWVAAFDRSQIAHTRHQRPLRLKLQEGLQEPGRAAEHD